MKEITNLNGSLIATETLQFDFIAKKIHVIRKDANRKIILEKYLPLPEDTVPGVIVGIPLRSFPFETGSDFSFHFLTEDLQILPVTAHVVRKELVGAPAGKVEAFRVQMIPHLGLLGLAAPVIPKMFIWQAVSPPHYWVKYEGLESTIQSPQVRMEITKMNYHD